MKRIFGKAKETAPPPNLTDVISGVNSGLEYIFLIWQNFNNLIAYLILNGRLIVEQII